MQSRGLFAGMGLTGKAGTKLFEIFKTDTLKSIIGQCIINMKICDVGTHLKRGICGEERIRRLETDSQSVDFFIIFVRAVLSAVLQ